MKQRRLQTYPTLRLDRALRLLVGALLIGFFAGCASERKQCEILSANLSMSSYAEARQHANPSGQPATLYFPVLEIYNDSGLLVYRGHESMTNAQILKEFPDSVRNLPAQADAPRLAAMVEGIPDFKSQAREILGKRRPVILSVALQDCAGCAVQERALEELKRHLIQQQSVAVLEVNVAHP